MLNQDPAGNGSAPPQWQLSAIGYARNQTGPPRSSKLVTVVVRDASGAATMGVLARESASFDCATGGSTTWNRGC